MTKSHILLCSSVYFFNLIFLFNKELKQINDIKGLYKLFCQKDYINNFIIWKDYRTYPNTDLFNNMFKWYDYQKLIFNNIGENSINLNIKEQINNIILYSAIIINKWNKEKEILIGCGKKNVYCYKNHNNQYTVDIDPQVKSDIIINFGRTSLFNAIPEAKGQIEKILLEGIIIDNSPCFYRDVLNLLKNGGCVYDTSGNNYKKIIIKKNDRLYTPDNKKYFHWKTKITNFHYDIIDDNKLIYKQLRIEDFGTDTLGWKKQIKKVKIEINRRNLKNSITPFDKKFNKNNLNISL